MKKNTPMKKFAFITIAILLFVIYSCEPNNVLNENIFGSLELEHVPLFIGHENNDVLKIHFEVDDSLGPLEIQYIELFFKKGSQLGFLKSSDVFIRQYSEIDTISEKLETHLRKGNRYNSG
jgi:hypothetical protein